MKTTIKILLVLLVTLGISCKENSNEQVASDTDNPASTSVTTEKQGQAFLKNDEATPNVLDIAIGSKDHTTLVAAVQAAELENVLVNNGPLMVFAPTNDAFDALPEGTV